MKRKTNYKNLISLALVLILLVALCVPSSYAIDTSKRRFGAWIMSAIQALNITMSSTLAPAQSMIDAIADPPGLVGVYEYPWEPDWDDEILDRSVIQIWPDYTEIDGVKYTDVWLSHDAAEKFRVNAFDWKTAYNITSENQGTFASGYGYINGEPLYQIGNVYQTQKNRIPAGESIFADQHLRSTTYPSSVPPMQTTRIEYPQGTYRGNITTKYPQDLWIQFNPPNTVTEYYENTSGVTTSFDGSYMRSGVVNNPFDFDWVSGTIPADTPLPQDTGMMIRVPSDTQGLQTFIENHVNFTLNGGVELDFDNHPELKIDVDDLMDILAPIIPVVNTGDIQFTVNHEAPIPPVPDVPIIDATVPQVVQPIINEIQNQGDIISQSIPPIIESIPKIDEICNNIDTAPYHDLDTGLDKLPIVFLPFITDLRSALGIWHYVTEWIGQISTTFAFVTGCLVGTSIMTPIYAAIAGFMCIKVYRRMTG